MAGDEDDITPGKPSLTWMRSTSMEIVWAPPYRDPYLIEWYQLELTTQSATEYILRPRSTTYVRLDNLRMGEMYGVRVRGLNGSDSTPWSPHSYLRIPNVPDLMGAPSLTHLPVPPTSIHASWTEPYDGGEGISRYDLQYSDDPNFSNYRIASMLGLSIWVDNLTPGKTWYFRTRAKNSQGDGPWGHVSSKLMAFGPRVVYNGQQKYTVPYVKHNGVWRLAVPYVKDAGTYKFAGG